MRSKLLLAFLAVFSLTTLFGQERIWTKQSKISEVIAFEKEINPEAKFLSKNVQILEDYYPLAEKYVVTDPVIVQRKPLEYLPIYAEYFYTPEDSILRLASFNSLPVNATAAEFKCSIPPPPGPVPKNV